LGARNSNAGAKEGSREGSNQPGLVTGNHQDVCRNEADRTRGSRDRGRLERGEIDILVTGADGAHGDLMQRPLFEGQLPLRPAQRFIPAATTRSISIAFVRSIIC
jgi:hypothetical protein